MPHHLKYLRNLFMKKRQPAATHVLAILLSEECRNKKTLLHTGTVYPNTIQLRISTFGIFLPK